MNDCLLINHEQKICSKETPIEHYNDNDFGYKSHWGKKYEDVVKDWFFGLTIK